MDRVYGWLTLLALMVFPHVVWAEDAKEHSDWFALLEFFDSPPVVAQNWPKVPTEFREKNRLPDDLALGLFLCDTDKPLVGCLGKMILLPFGEISSIVRDRNLANVNLKREPEHLAWVVVDKNGKKYRAEVPPFPLVLFTGDPAKARFDHFVRVYSSLSGAFENGIGATPELPVYAIDFDKGMTSYRTISPRSLKGFKFVSRADAQGAVEKYVEDERARIKEQNRKDEQARLAREERERANEARRKEAEARAAFFRRAIKPGDQSHCGMIIEVKKPIVQVQTMIGPVWLKINQIHPPGDYRCLFENGVYRE